MQRGSNLTDEVKEKIMNFINESSDMKRKYNIEEEEKLLSGLPVSLSDDYYREANFEALQGLQFFRHVS